MLASSPINSSPISNNNVIGAMGSSPPATNINIAMPGVNLNNVGVSPLTNQLTSVKSLSKQDREALLQYTKHFVRKAIQIIVQSRLGEKKPTKSKVYAYNADWVKN
jgi:hypothetical protein